MAPLPGVAAMHIARHGKPKPDHQRHHRRPAVRNERQRDADHRHQPRHHREIDEDINEKRHRRAGDREPGETVLTARGHPHHHQDEKRVNRDQEQKPGEAPLLANDAGDEVGVLLGDKVEPDFASSA